MKVRIVELMKEKSQRDGMTITQEMVAKATNIPQGTLSRWAGNKVARLDKSIMAALCAYFECEVGDLLMLERDRVA
ncbi:MAG: helix-turn-helix transcriptional regulator [Anaerolineae bacterium]|nr:helix-turn-helix transcriptional regulator [Anaerolineae bacterium]